MEKSPNELHVAVVDNQNRVLVFDTMLGTVVHVWKGYHHVQGSCYAVPLKVADFELEVFALSQVSIQGDKSVGKPGLGSLGFGMFHRPAWAVGSYSSGHQLGELPKSKSTQPRFATRWVTL